MKPGDRLPGDQAEIAFSDRFAEQLDGLPETERLDILATVVALRENPGGTHTLSTRGRDRTLVGWNTLEVSRRKRRVVYKVDEDAASFFVLCIGSRRESEVYDTTAALASSGALTDAETTQLWDALSLFDILAEDLGLDEWDYRPEPAPEGQRRAAVAAGLLEEALASLMSRDELVAAMEGGWGPDGPDPARALDSALRRARGNATFDSARWVIEQRGSARCNAPMPRARAACIRRAGHPGPHRAR